MPRNYLKVFLVLLLISAEGKGQITDTIIINSNIKLNSGPSFIRFSNETGLPINIGVSYNLLVPSNRNFDTVIDVSRGKMIKLNIDRPLLSSITINKNQLFKCFILPGDTVYIKIDKNAGGNTYAFNFDGRNQVINRYYQQKKESLKYYSASEIMFPLSNLATGIRDIRQRIDSCFKVEMTFLESWKVKLPLWFYSREAAIIEINKMAAIFMAADKRNLSMAELGLVEPKSRLSLASILPTAGKLEYVYYLFLQSYAFARINRSEEHTFPEMYLDAVKVLKKERLDPVSLELFHGFWLSWMISSLSNEQMLKEYTELWSYCRADVMHSFIENSIDHTISAKRAQLEGTGFLKKGMAVPLIEFVDRNNVKVALSDFNGKWVYVDLWGTWCTACISDFETKERVFSDLGDDNIVFVNICMLSNHESWLRFIKTRKFMGMQWFADRQVSKELEREYSIYGLPHYILIQPNGKIYENAALRPGQIHQKLKQLVATSTQ